MEERIPGFGAGMTVQATGRTATRFVTPHTVAMVGSFETQGIAVVTLTIFRCLLEMVRRERLHRMTVATGDPFAAAAAVMTAYAVRVFRHGTGGVMMALAAISDHVGMAGVIEQNRGEILAEEVNPYLCRRCCRGRK